MIGEVCRFYGWTVDYVLGMYSARFFTMRQAAQSIHAKEMYDLTDLYLIPQVKTDWYKQVKERYRKESLQDYRPDLCDLDNEVSDVVRPGHSVEPMTEKQTQEAVLHLFSMKKRGG